MRPFWVAHANKKRGFARHLCSPLTGKVVSASITVAIIEADQRLFPQLKQTMDTAREGAQATKGETVLTYTFVRPAKFAGRIMLRLPLATKTLMVASIVMFAGVTTAPVLLADTANIARAEEMIWGSGGKSNPSEGRAVLENAAEQSDATAQRVLGMHLIYGWVLEKDTALGLSLLSTSAQSGDATSQFMLGEVLLWGLAGKADVTRARELLEAAIQKGEKDAMRVLGEQLVVGELFERDTETGVALLERAIAMRDTKAEVVLGKYFLEGQHMRRDRARALELFEAAATTGDGSGLALYGEDLMWREAGATTAEKMLSRAAALGETKAFVTLAEGAMYGYLGGGAISRAKYAGYAEKARDADEPRIEVLEAERSMWGIGMRASGPETIARLTKGADKGNTHSAKALIALLRDGNGLNVRRSKTDAAAALDAYGDLLSDSERAEYDFTLKAATARTPIAYAEVASAFEAWPQFKSRQFGSEIYKANPNVAFYILQVRLKEKGLYGGALNGYATRRTLDAVYKACLALGDSEPCNDNVMRSDVIGMLLAQD